MDLKPYHLLVTGKVLRYNIRKVGKTKEYFIREIYEKIFARLEELHMSQIELSRRTGIATSTILGDTYDAAEKHRLSSCKFCDEIAVFYEGAVIRQGSHERLVAEKGGKYYELWNAQAQYYTE